MAIIPKLFKRHSLYSLEVGGYDTLEDKDQFLLAYICKKVREEFLQEQWEQTDPHARKARIISVIPWIMLGVCVLLFAWASFNLEKVVAWTGLDGELIIPLSFTLYTSLILPICCFCTRGFPTFPEKGKEEDQKYWDNLYKRASENGLLYDHDLKCWKRVSFGK